MPCHALTALRVSALAAFFWAASPKLVAQDFPRPPDDPASIARGKQTFSVNCGFCHGSDARGGEGGGPNLLRSAIVLADHKGEILSAVVLNGRPDKGMPKFNLPQDDIGDVAAFLHSLSIGRGAGEPMDPKRVLVGSANAGRAYFNGKGLCSKCHSVTQDLAGIGSKYDPKTLQDRIFTGGGTGMLGVPLPTAPPRTVAVTLPTGEMITGTLVSIDDFAVVLIDAKGDRRTIPRNADTPKVQTTNPLQAHVDMILRWEDRDLHDLTAYLATIK
jgi:cytochrome c oxidase cbb3-type subunit III